MTVGEVRALLEQDRLEVLSSEESDRIIANLVKDEALDTLKELAGVEEDSWFYVYALGTFSDNVVFEVSSDSGCKYYRVEYTINRRGHSG